MDSISSDVPEIKCFNSPKKENTGDESWNPADKQESDTKDEKATTKSENRLIEETKRWHVLVKMDRVPFLEKLIFSTKLALSEASNGSRNSENSLVEELKKAIIYVCARCDMLFKFRQSLYEHNQRVHVGKTFTCKVCGRIFSRMSCFIGHKKFAHSDERPFKCSECNSSFKAEKFLDRHRQIHSGGKFKCEVCKKSFNRKDVLKIHMRRHFPTQEGRRHMCNVCGKAFHQKSTLTHHMMVHTGERPYKCDLCDRTFIQSGHYYEHRREHNTKIVCKTCGKTLKCYGSLKHHQKVHQRIRPFVCITCKKAFKSKLQLKSHVLLHQPKKLLCYVCKKYFRHASTLKGHITTHFKEVPYKCEICELPFQLKKRLDKHIAEDHQMRRFECNLCKESFLYRNTLLKHNRTQKHLKRMMTFPNI